MSYLFQQNFSIFFRTIKFLLIFSVVLWIFSACKHAPKKKDKFYYPQQGTMQICVDESFEPVIDQQIEVFEASFPKAKINVKYEAESNCFNDFQNDSVSMIVVARGLKEDESEYYNSRLGHRPLYSVMAFDAVAVIVNAHAKDSTFSLQDLYKLLTDKTAGNKQAIVDGDNATSTVRYLMDSVTRGKPFGANVQGVKGSKAVLDAVAENENAVGFVGLSWIGNYDDPQQAAYADKVHFAYVQSKQIADADTYAKPTQATIYNEQYPLVRTLYCIVKSGDVGLASSFYNFMSFERGQLIFRRANLVAAKMNFTIRTIRNDTGKLKN